MNDCELCDGFGPEEPGTVCPRCGSAQYRPLSLQEIAAWEEADEPGYAEATSKLLEERLTKQRAEDAEAARLGILEGLADNCPKWLVVEFEDGLIPCDEPPGFVERAYRMWKEAGGTIKPPKPVTADDL